MKSVFGFRVRLGNPDLDFENLNPDFPIERTLRHVSLETSLVQVPAVLILKKKQKMISITITPF